MSDYTNIIQEINTNLPDNTEQLITAEKVRTTLIDMVGVVSDVEEELDANIEDKADKDTTPFILEVEDITQLTNEQVESLKAGDIVSADLAYLVSFKESSDCFLTSYDGADLFICTYYKENDIWVCDGISSHNLDTFANKVNLATNGDFAGLDSNGNLTDSGSKASDFATAAQGALADTAYQKPPTGIPASDLAPGTIPTPDVFWALYNVSPLNDLNMFYNQGKLVVMVDDNDNLYMPLYISSTVAYFYSVDATQGIKTITVNANNQYVSNSLSNIETANNKVSTLTGYETDTQYPSAKCVYDSLQEKTNKVSNATNGNFAGLDSNGNLTDSGYNTLSFPNVLRVSDITQLTSEQCESLHIGDIVVGGSVSYLVTTLDDTDIDLSYADSDTITTVIYSRDNTSEPWQYITTTRYSLSTKPNKPSTFTNGHLAALDILANLTDSGKAVSDFATAAQGELADTAYQKPLTGIPASDLADGVIPQPEVFFAEYGVTTTSEIENAVINGKVIVCIYNYWLYVYGGYTVGYNTKHWFYCWVNNKCYQISLAPSTDAWTDDGYIEIPDISGKADKTSVVTLTGTSVTQELANNTIYQCSELSSLTITIPNVVTADYISQINFESGSTATTLTAPNTIIWFGDDLINDVFVPSIGKQYVVIFYYDGINVRSIVQSE